MRASAIVPSLIFLLAVPQQAVGPADIPFDLEMYARVIEQLYRVETVVGSSELVVRLEAPDRPEIQLLIRDVDGKRTAAVWVPSNGASTFTTLADLVDRGQVKTLSEAFSKVEITRRDFDLQPRTQLWQAFDTAMGLSVPFRPPGRFALDDATVTLTMRTLQKEVRASAASAFLPRPITRWLDDVFGELERLNLVPSVWPRRRN